MTMPGALFIRSPSMEPTVELTTKTTENHVRFSFQSQHSPDPAAASASRGPSSAAGSPYSPTRNGFKTDTRKRSQMGSSVKAAVDKFVVGEEDADPSLLLPSPKKSPHAHGTTQYIHTKPSSTDGSPTSKKDKGKGRAVEPDLDIPPSSGSRRGDGRKSVPGGEEYDKNHGSDDENVESETSSRAQSKSDPHNDKARIEMLEREVERLKEEVSTRS